jgi:hypothetical protein
MPLFEKLQIAADAQGHTVCGIDGCQRLKPKHAHSCWRHEEKDPVFVLLDRLIAEGITQCRLALEEKYSNVLMDSISIILDSEGNIK